MEFDLHQKLVSFFSDFFQLNHDTDIESFSRKGTDFWDSFAHLRLIIELEQVFEISISDEEVANLNSFRDVKMFLSNHGLRHKSGEADENRDMRQNVG